MTNTATTSDERQQPSIVINDFSPGCYDASLTSNSIPTPSPQSAPGPFPAPLGAADANFTHGCMNLPTGGLGPLPQMVQSHSMGDFGMSVPAGATVPFIASFFCTGMAGQGGNDEILVTQIYKNNSGNQNIYVNSFNWNTTGTNHNIVGINQSLVPYAFPPTVCYPFMSRVAPSGQGPTITPGYPVVVIPIAYNNFTTSLGMLLYPNPNTNNQYSYELVTTGTSYPGYTFGHQGRIVQLCPVPNVSWPPQVVTPPNSAPGQYAFEAISYTDPPNSTTWGNQLTIFGPENPWGYGAVTSVSAGELFMVKQQGGGIIVQGDINNPTVTTLPGVKTTGPIYGKTGTDQNGAYYCADDHGAWVWNGGNSSTKISAQLDNNFYTPPNMPPLQFNGVQHYGYFCQRWGDWMLFSNNWIYNSGGGGGWWRLYDPAVASFFFYSQGADDDIMYACVPYAPTTNTTSFFRFDETNPTNTYQWRSLPIRPQAGDRTINVREVTVRAANPTLDPAATVAVMVGPTTLGTWTLTNTGTGVQIHTFNAGQVQADDIVVSLLCNGTTTAPIIYDLSIGYRVRERAALQ